MKVLQINSVCGYGSTGRIAADIYKILEEQGHECLIAYGRGSAPKGINTIKIGTDFDNYIHVAKTRLFDIHGFASTKATKKFIEKAKEYNPDVIHLHNIHGYYLNIEVLFEYLREANKPVIWTLHDCWSFTGHCAYFDYVGCDKWKNGCKNCPDKREYPESILFDNSKNNYAVKKKIFTSYKNITFVTPSLWLANLVKKSYMRDYKVEVIPNGIDLNVFKSTEGNFRKKNDIEDKIVILGVASVWDRRKGLDIFVELSEKIDKDYQIVIVGVTENQKKQLPENIIAITRTNNIQELVEIYSAANVYVNPTLEDNFPTTNIEALACGTPVVTYNTGGSPECLEEGCGGVVNKGDINSLMEKIIKYGRDKDVPKICVDKALEYEKEFEYLKYIDLYIDKKNS